MLWPKRSERPPLASSYLRLTLTLGFVGLLCKSPNPKKVLTKREKGRHEANKQRRCADDLQANLFDTHQTRRKCVSKIRLASEVWGSFCGDNETQGSGGNVGRVKTGRRRCKYWLIGGGDKLFITCLLPVYYHYTNRNVIEIPVAMKGFSYYMLHVTFMLQYLM